MMENESRESSQFVRRIATDEKLLVLTFDDGPDEHYTPAVLDILAHYEVPATFFCIGSQVEKHPDVMWKMVDGGHIIANHSWSHPFLTKESPETVRRQVDETAAIINDTVSLRTRLFRPPYGDVNDEVATQLRALGYDIILWDVDSVDWSGIAGPQIAANVLPQLRPGAVVLHHSAGHVSGTVDALPYEIEVAHARGYRFVALDTLLGRPPYAP